MIFNDIIKSSEYVYSTFTKWGLKKFICHVEYFTEESLNDLFYVICSILNSNDGIYDKRSLGILLGFSMYNHNDNGKHDFYYDVAEVRMFEDILAEVENEHLIKIVEHDVILTKLGSISLKENKHYRFYKGEQAIYEHLKLKSETPTALLMFPFYKDMGIETQLSTKSSFWPDDDEIDSIIYYEKNQLIKRIENHSSSWVNVYNAFQEEYFDVDIKNVAIKLYLKGEEYIPMVMNGDEVSPKATQLLLEPINIDRKEDVILECLFQKLWDDKTAVFNYNTLSPYFELVDFEELTKDNRTEWLDEDLFSVITNRSNQTCWRNISRFCNIEVLYKNIDFIKEKIDWPIFSTRVDDSFLVNTFINYPWDLEVISEDPKRDIKVIEQLILLQKDTEEDWNWDSLEQRLSSEFVLSHLDLVNVNLSRYTEDNSDVHNAILNNIEQRWDWEKIETSFDLDFILYNILALAHQLTFDHLFDRVFTDESWATRYATSEDFKIAISTACENDGPLASSIYNDKNYIWTPVVIDMFSTFGLISWASTPYMKGFECNPYIKWDSDFFNRYSSCVLTDEGREIVSESINDIDILLNNSEFDWAWDKISTNPALISDVRLYEQCGDKLNWLLIFRNQEDIDFIQNIEDVESMIADDEDAWTEFSGLASLDYVKSQYKSKGFPWNWSVLTERMFNDLKLENIGHPLFVEKWDWRYLSEHINQDFLLENLDKYKNYWVWDVVFSRIMDSDRRFDLAFLDKLANILSNINNKDRISEAWSALTKIYSFKELKKLITITLNRRSYWWDINYFCQHEDFDVFVDLEKFYNLIDWDAISTSKVVDNAFKFNPKLKIKIKAWNEDVMKLLSDSRYKWDFKSLSAFDSLRDQRWFISKYRDRIDWDYISQYSRIFVEDDKQRLNEVIEAYKKFINFKVLSERKDVNIEQIIKIHPKANYDYNSLMERGIIKVNMSIVDEMPDYEWDWQLLSSSSSFVPKASWLLEKIDVNLNWEALTNHENDNAWGNEDLLSKMAKNSDISSKVNWKFISEQKVFPLKVELLMILPFDKLNWKTISQRRNVFDIIDAFKDMLDWKIISSSKHLNVSEIEVLYKYKDYLDWHTICSREDFQITNQILNEFANYIDWDKASSSLHIDFTRELVDNYQDRWNWPVLVKNKAFNNKINVSDMPYMKQINIVEFINHFPRKPQAFHFTHMSNALKIIRNMKLQSRNYAEGNFTNSAGSNVHRTAKAHRFARFYFMPKSPTQFYNECLGKDKGDRYYMKARNLGLPKCPLPVFFVFDVEELLMTIPDKCYYSTGNMQKDSARSFKVIEEPNRIKAREIYINSYDTFNERQQEFLIEGELDFSKLKKVQIVCYDSFQAEMLRKELVGTPWMEVISTNGNLYEHCNKEIRYNDSDNSIRISTNGYRNSFEFKVVYHNNNVPTIINKNMVIRQRDNNIFIQDSVELNKDVPFEVYFETKDPRIESWLIYKNSVS